MLERYTFICDGEEICFSKKAVSYEDSRINEITQKYNSLLFITSDSVVLRMKTFEKMEPYMCVN